MSEALHDFFSEWTVVEILCFAAAACFAISAGYIFRITAR